MQTPVSPDALAVALQRDAQANAQLLRGLALLDENTPASLRVAVGCFDAAIALRRELPLAENCWFRYGLIAGWLNRGDALTRLGAADELREALRSYDEALTQLRELPMAASPLFVKRLAIAWLNRGVTLLTQGSPRDVSEAIQCFDDAIAAARNFSSSHPADGRALLARAWVNRGNALIRLDPPPAESALIAARTALELCAASADEDAVSAGVAFNARHVLCQALAHRLVGPTLRPTQREEFLTEATDAVDAGMALARSWEARGADQFRVPAARLFQFGCRVYQTYQPHFLTEFLLENLDPLRSDGAFARDLPMHAAAAQALWQTLRELQRDGFKTLNTPAFEKMLASLRELRIAAERLAELRAAQAAD